MFATVCDGAEGAVLELTELLEWLLTLLLDE